MDRHYRAWMPKTDLSTVVLGRSRLLRQPQKKRIPEIALKGLKIQLGGPVMHLAVSEHHRGHLLGLFYTCHILKLIRMGFSKRKARIWAVTENRFNAPLVFTSYHYLSNRIYPCHRSSNVLYFRRLKFIDLSCNAIFPPSCSFTLRSNLDRKKAPQ